MQIINSYTNYLQGFTGKIEYSELVQASNSEAISMKNVETDEIACTMTISDEAKAWLEECKEKDTPEEQFENEKVKDETIDYAQMLESYKKQVTGLYRNYKPKTNDELEEERLAALEEQRKLKELEEEEYRRKLEEARQAANDNIQNHDKLHKNTSDLLILLESIERMKDKEDESDKSRNPNNIDSNEALSQDPMKKDADSDDSLSIGKPMETLASYTVRSAFMKETHANQSVDSLMAEGHNDIREGNDTYKKIIRRANSAIKAIQDDSFQTEKAQIEEYNKVTSINLLDLEYMVSYGKQKKIYAREMNISGQGIATMVAASKLKDSLMDIAGDDYIDENINRILDKSQEELAQKAQEKIDEKDTVPKNDEKAEEDVEKDKNISEEDRENADGIESLYEMLLKEEQDNRQN